MARAAALMVACGVGGAAFVPGGCNPLGYGPTLSCMMPWPSDHFRSTTWNATATPSLAYLTNDTFPIANDSKVIDPAAGGWKALTGFSPSGSAIAYLPGVSLDKSRLPRLWNVSASGARDATSVLLDTTTNSILLHWVELDHNADASEPPEGYPRATLLWSAGRLRDATRYIVAYRSLVDGAGVPLQASDGFAALRDGTPTSSPDIEASRPRFEGIFSALSALGWSRSSIVLAWDFTTATAADVTGRVVAMRDDAFARVAAAGGLKYVIDKVTENPRDGIARQVNGHFSVPVYLNTVLPIPGSVLVLNPATGLPAFQSWADFNFTVAVPHSIANGSVAPGTGRFMQYGHGLFGSQSEMEGGYLSSWADQYGYVIAAVDEIGLSEEDAPAAALILASDITQFGYIPDRCQQGLLNELLATRLVTQSSFRTDPVMTFNGAPAVSADYSAWHYYGNSQGGILGTVYMAVTTDIVRGVIGVGGGPYSLLLPRSSDFADLAVLIEARYTRPMDRIALLSAIQALWDRAEPSGYLHAISGTPLPGTPAHRIVLQHGLADAQVSWMGARYIAYSTNALMYASNAGLGNESLAHFNRVSDSTVITSGNVAMTWDFQAPDWAQPLVNVPPVNKTWDSHEWPRRQATAQAQMAEFFLTGRVTNTCGGRCVAPHGDPRLPLTPGLQKLPAIVKQVQADMKAAGVPAVQAM